MSNNLNLPALVGGQANPETTVNDAVGGLDAALTEKVVVDLTNSLTVTALVYRSAIRFSITPSGTAKTLTLPAIKRMAIISNDSTHSLTLAVGSTTVAMAVNDVLLIYTDGTANGLSSWPLASAAAPVPYDIALSAPGLLTASQRILRYNVVRAITLPINLTGSLATADVAATASSTFTIKKNGTSIGTVTFAAGASVGTFTFAAAVSFVATDIITIDAPGSADATLSGVAFTFAGTRP